MSPQLDIERAMAQQIPVNKHHGLILPGRWEGRYRQREGDLKNIMAGDRMGRTDLTRGMGQDFAARVFDVDLHRQRLDLSPHVGHKGRRKERRRRERNV